MYFKLVRRTLCFRCVCNGRITKIRWKRASLFLKASNEHQKTVMSVCPTISNFWNDANDNFWSYDQNRTLGGHSWNTFIGFWGSLTFPPHSLTSLLHKVDIWQTLPLAYQRSLYVAHYWNGLTSICRYIEYG